MSLDRIPLAEMETNVEAWLPWLARIKCIFFIALAHKEPGDYPDQWQWIMQSDISSRIAQYWTRVNICQPNCQSKSISFHGNVN